MQRIPERGVERGLRPDDLDCGLARAGGDRGAGNKPAAAAELGISLKTLYNKLNQLQDERRNVG